MAPDHRRRPTPKGRPPRREATEPEEVDEEAPPQLTSPASHPVSNKVFANILLGAVTLMGLANFFAQFFVAGYQPDATITLLFAGVAGIILGVKKRGEG